MARYFWTNKEAEIVSRHYATGGATAVMKLLPNRTRGSIYQQAKKQGVMYGDNKPRPRQVWETTGEMDRLITECYRSEPERGKIKMLARNISRPYWWVKKRAAALGLATQALNGNKELEWSEAEISLLEENSYKNHEVIARIFRAKGFKRTATAIVVKRTRLQCDTVDIDHYTATQLAIEFGVDSKVVTRWIDRGWLKARRRGTDRTDRQGGDMWWIKRKQVRAFIVDSIGIVDIRKVNKIWFVDILANP